MQTSNCCNKPIFVTGGEELTNFYVCQGCQKACDAVSEGGYITKSNSLLEEHIDCEVIGDIYQNPELLNTNA